MENTRPFHPDATGPETAPLLHFEVLGKPVAWKRPQQARNGHRYNDKKVDAFQTRIADAAAVAMCNRLPTASPVVLDVTVILPIPPSWPNWKRAAAKEGRWHAVARPDFDNFAKGVADALNCIVYGDDAQVVEATVRKLYSPRPRLVVTVEELQQAENPRAARAVG